MTLTIKLTPHEEAALKQEAARYGTEPNVLAHELLFRQLLTNNSHAVSPGLPPPLAFDEQTWTAVLSALSEDSVTLPAPPPEAFTRESLYADHD